MPLPPYDPDDYDLDVKRCPQGCCATFTLEIPEYLKAESTPEDDVDDASRLAWWAAREATPERAETLRNMLVPLDSLQRADEPPRERSYPHFTCAHYDDTNGLCTIYKQMPDFCALVPNDQCGGCSICGLTDPMENDRRDPIPVAKMPPEVPVNSQDAILRSQA